MLRGLPPKLEPHLAAVTILAFALLHCPPIAAGALGPTTQPAVDAAAQPQSPTEEQFSLHLQATSVTQGHGHFHSPYEGPLSLRDVNELRTSFTATPFLGMRLWPGAEGYVNPEAADGRGIGGGTGLGGYPNGEVQRVGTAWDWPYLARLYVRQTIGFGGETEKIESDQNQLAGSRDVSRLTFTVGKFAVTDFFDQNAYSHDARTQFLNFSLMDNTAWDIPADVRGYTLGTVVELNQAKWAVRYGIFGMPSEANGTQLDDHYDNAFGQAVELETRHTVFNQPGKIRWLAFLNRAHMGSYRETLDTPEFNEDITLSRRYSQKYGFGISLEQQITDDLGLFARLGWNDGHTETFAFTEVDRTASIGLSLKGTKWSRPDDTVGLAGVIDGLAKDHRDYLRAGGSGFMLGDGRLAYAPEQIIESYYSFKVLKGLFVSMDVQFINHPGYNSDRGPLWVGGFRVHYQF